MINQNIFLMFMFAPFISLMVYVIMKFFAHFRF